MSEQAMSKEALLTSLVDIELPQSAAGGLIGEVAAVLALASLAALMLAGTLRLFSHQPSRAVPSEADIIAAMLSLPEAERRLAMLRWLRAKKPEQYQEFASNLYLPDGGPDLARLEAAVGANV